MVWTHFLLKGQFFFFDIFGIKSDSEWIFPEVSFSPMAISPVESTGSFEYIRLLLRKFIFWVVKLHERVKLRMSVILPQRGSTTRGGCNIVMI